MANAACKHYICVTGRSFQEMSKKKIDKAMLWPLIADSIINDKENQDAVWKAAEDGDYDYLRRYLSGEA